MSEQYNDLENLQWDAFEQALLSIESQVANLRAMLAALRENKGEGRHMRTQWHEGEGFEDVAAIAQIELQKAAYADFLDKAIGDKS
jgi:hypothetical protein